MGFGFIQPDGGGPDMPSTLSAVQVAGFKELQEDRRRNRSIAARFCPGDHERSEMTVDTTRDRDSIHGRHRDR
ncbi:hypothetical protein [Streptomyces sp. NPDC001530]|uniref:hypothetical protein n=1 Tax=Streptomyces sp. NPDC001530 TaxID=3364582 RepID=UPI0036B9579E